MKSQAVIQTMHRNGKEFTSQTRTSGKIDSIKHKKLYHSPRRAADTSLDNYTTTKARTKAGLHLRPPQTKVGSKCNKQHAAQHSWAILVIVQAFRVTLTEFIGAVDEDSSGVGDSEEGGESEQCCANETRPIVGWNEVEQSSCNCANEYCIVEPFLKKSGG